MNARLLLLLVSLGLLGASRGQVYEKVYSFTDAVVTDITSSPNKGSSPLAGLVQGIDGNFYGTTNIGGASGYGTVFKMTPAGVVTTLVEFTSNGPRNKGSFPNAGLVQGSDGNFYGTTFQGGASVVVDPNGYGYGTVFKMTPAGVLTTLVEFTGNETSNKGNGPSKLLQSSDGNFYGTTISGGADDYGTVFRMTPTGGLTTLVSFTYDGTSNRGAGPSELVQSSDGNFYGTTFIGGADDYGTVFKMTPAGVLTTLVEFTKNGATNKGSYPKAALVQGSDGNFYGTTFQGGASVADDPYGDGYGTVFKMTPAGGLTTLVEFTDNGATNKGSGPKAALVQGSDGNFYGTTQFGGADFAGTVFRMTPAGVLTTLVEFGTSGPTNKGSYPEAALVQGSDGNFYGATQGGGKDAQGTVFKITPAGALTTLVDFTGNGSSNRGFYPSAALVQGSDGNFYGTTGDGGANFAGTVFKMTPAGALTTLVEFTRNGVTNKGNGPNALVQGSDGNFYGTTFIGGADDYGTVFRMTPAGALTTLVEFTRNGVTNKGYGPNALVQGSDGNFYGTTQYGGANDYGTVFRMTPAGVLTTLVEFTNNGATNKGSYPKAALVQGSDGNFYGTTERGGATDDGTVFKMTPAGVLTTLVEFDLFGATNKGSFPSSDLVQGGDGNFYGTTYYGGANYYGTVFKMTPAGELTTLVEFTRNGAANKGSYPSGGLLQGSDGNFYGTTKHGGASLAVDPHGFGYGTVFKMTPAGVLTTVLEFSEDGFPVGELLLASDGALYGVASGAVVASHGTIYRLLFPGAPAVSSNTIHVLGNSDAVLDATVNARGSSTTVMLEYGTDGTTFPNTVPVAIGVTGFQTRLLGTTLSGLTASTEYFFRFRAQSSAGMTVSPVQSFSTLAAPLVTIDPASDITPTSARFNGTVNARSFDASVVFEWGNDGFNFPNLVPAVPGTVTGNSAVAVSADVVVPQGSTVYFRIRASNAGGTVTTGARGFNTGLGANTSALSGADIGVTDVLFKATVNTFGQTAQVKFKYWADSAPGTVFETATQTVTTSGPQEVSARVTGLAENVAYRYRVSVELAGTETDGGAVQFSTDANQAPVAGADTIFYFGSVVFSPLGNDTDANNKAPTPANAGLGVVQIVTQPQVAAGVAQVIDDGQSIKYTPQFNVLNDDSLTYRIADPQGAPADGQVRLVSFAKRAGRYGTVLSGTTQSGAPRSGVISIKFGDIGALTESSVQWQGEIHQLKGVFDSDGQVRIPLTIPGGTLDIVLRIDPDQARVTGSVTETDGNGAIVASLDPVELKANAGAGGLAEGGLRTAFFDTPAELTGQAGSGYLLLTVAKTGRAARIVGRLPDGSAFGTVAREDGTKFKLLSKLKPNGLLSGDVRVVQIGGETAGIVGSFEWRRRGTPAGQDGTTIEIHGAEYPSLGSTDLPPLALGAGTPNARLSFSGGGIDDALDFPLHIARGAVSGFDTSALKLKLQPSRGTFSGRFIHPHTGRPVPFSGALRVPFDGDRGQGRGVFRLPGTAGEVTIQVVAP